MAELFTLPKQVPIQSSGAPWAGAKAYFYRAGTTTDQAVYTDAACSVAHAQPVVADANGVFAPIYKNPNASYDYRLQLKQSDGTLIYDVDNIPRFTLTQAQIGALFYPRTAAEIAAGVTPTYYYYEPGDVRRYGADSTGASFSDTAFDSALTAYDIVFVPRGTYKRNNPTVLGNGQMLLGEQSGNVSASNVSFIDYYGTGNALTIDGGAGYQYQNWVRNISFFARGSAVGTAIGAYLRRLSEWRLESVYLYGFDKAHEIRECAIGWVEKPVTSECNYGFYFTEDASSHLTIKQANCWESANAAVSIRASVNHLIFDDCWFEYFKYGWEIVPTSGSQLGVRMYVNNSYVNTADSGLASYPICIPVYINLGGGSVPLYSEHLTFKNTLLGSPDSGTNTSVVTITGTAGTSTIKEFLFDNCILSGGNTAGIETTLPDIQWELRGDIRSMSAYYGGDVSLFASAPSKLADYRVNQANTWTPTWTGSGGNPSLGNGTLTGVYERTGKIVDVWIKLVMGSTTTYGTGTWYFDLPVAATTDAIGEMYILDSGTTNYNGVVRVTASTDLITMNVHNNASNVGPTVPHTWATGDEIWCHARYRAQS